MRVKWFWTALPIATALTLFSGVFFSGCEEGTEVGNPEVMVSARLDVRQSDSGMIPDMMVKVMGMSFQAGSDSGNVWATSSGMMVNMAGKSGGSELPATPIQSSAWTGAEVMLSLPAGDSSMCDSIPFLSLHNPRYVKLVKKMGSDTLHLLFEWPRNMSLKLMFNQASIQSWTHSDSVNVHVTFDGDKWAAGVDAMPSVSRMDGAGKPFMILSPSENSASYDKLKAMLPACFLADSVKAL